MNKNAFQDPARAGIFHLPAPRWEAAETAAGAAGLKVMAAPLAQPKDKEEALRQLGCHLGFPTWYGANLDALYDCLTDPEWQPSPGHALFISGLDSLQGADLEGFSSLIDVFRSACEARQEAGSPLWVLLDSPAPDLSFLPGS